MKYYQKKWPDPLPDYRKSVPLHSQRKGARVAEEADLESL